MATLQKTDAVEFATQYYNEQEPQMKKDFIESLSTRLYQSILQGEQDIKNGNTLTMDELEAKIKSLKL